MPFPTIMTIVLYSSWSPILSRGGFLLSRCLSQSLLVIYSLLLIIWVCLTQAKYLSFIERRRQLPYSFSNMLIPLLFAMVIFSIHLWLNFGKMNYYVLSCIYSNSICSNCYRLSSFIWMVLIYYMVFSSSSFEVHFSSHISLEIPNLPYVIYNFNKSCLHWF